MFNQNSYTELNPNMYGIYNPYNYKSNIKTFNWDKFINNTQKTLNVINQALPIYNQIKPMFRNVGTFIKIMNGLKEPANVNNNNNNDENNIINKRNNPQFFA